jgi:FkbM family methyltransferase
MLNNMYSQNQEEQYITDYFKDFKGTLLDLGANDGKMFSNSLRLIELGWRGFCVEPSPKAFKKLSELHKENWNVECIQVAIGESNMKAILAESGWHLNHKSDVALLSSLMPSETKKWTKVSFDNVEVEVIDYKTLTELIDCKTFDFISIDIEGFDTIVLKQIDLTNTKLLCIEWNSIESVKKEILEYTSKFGMNKIIYQSGENLIICKG